MKSIIKDGEILPVPERRIIDTGFTPEIVSINKKLISLCASFDLRDKSDISEDVYELIKTFDKSFYQNT